MSEFMFGTETNYGKKISDREAERRNKIAVEVAGPRAGFTRITEPTGFKSWFSIPNQGCPFDRQTANEILKKCGLPLI